jgi:4-amino-4-deoxy-L-arabinose transferase-like glycosyltransferase
MLRVNLGIVVLQGLGNSKLFFWANLLYHIPISLDKNVSNQRQIFPYILLILLSLWLFLPGITHIPAFDRDESRFVQASKQMVETHNFEQINFQDKPRHLKPPGIYWLQAGATKVFAHGSLDNVWSYRVPSVLGGVLSVILLFGFFSKEIGRERAFLAAGVLASTLLLVLESHMGTTDAMLLACMVLMQGGLWKAYSSYKASGKAPLSWVCVFWLGMACGVFIKGTSPLIGMLTIAGLCINERSIQFLKQVRPILGLIGLILVSLIWIIPFSQAGHSNFLWDMIHKDALPKVLGSAQGHGAWPGYFLVLLPLMFWPCSILLFRGFTLGWQRRKQVFYRFLFSWIIPCWIFIALVHTKLPEYALPIYPALALMVAALCVHKIKLKGRLAKIDLAYRLVWLVLSIVIAFAFPVVSYLLLNRLAASSIALCVSVLLLGVMLFKLAGMRFYRSCILISLLGGVFIYGFICQFFLEAMQPMWISQKVQAAIAGESISLSATQPLYAADFTEPSLVFYLGTHNVHFSSVSDIEGMMRDHKITYALLSVEHFEELKAYAKKHHYQVKPLDFMQGFNYENGKKLNLVLVKRVSR